MDDKPLTAREAAAYLGISRRAFDRLKLQRIEYGKRLIRYERAVLDAYKLSKGAPADPPLKRKAKGRGKRRRQEQAQGFDFAAWLAGKGR
jgi:hypothetical protein